MTGGPCRPVAFALAFLMVLSFVWSNPGSPDVVRADTRVETLQDELPYDFGAVNTEWTVDEEATIDDTFMSKIQTGLRERISSMGTETVKVAVFANSISLLHEALREGRVSVQEDIPLADQGLGTTVMELPANIIPKVASLPNVQAILEYELPEAPDPEEFSQGPFSGDPPSPQMWQVTLTQGAVEA
jgi:hypothetical protein